MGLKYSSFNIRGVDVSEFNGVIDWSKVANTHFAAVRVGYGRTIESEFVRNWAKAKGKVNRIPYWYMDYYSNHRSGNAVFGMPDAEWGRRQAELCFNALKNDPEGCVFLDIENGNPSYAPPMTTVTARAQAIAKAFLQRMDELNGRFNGIYCSLGALSWFAQWFKDRPLWVARYNEAQTISSVLAAVRKTGWTGPCVIWQYASDGDVNDDGVADGLAMGMQYGFLDLNTLIGGTASWKVIYGEAFPYPAADQPEVELPVDETDGQDPNEYSSYVVKVSVLMLRSKPFVASSTLVGKLFTNLPLKISKTVTIDNRIWGMVAVQGWWVCLKEGTNVFAEAA